MIKTTVILCQGKDDKKRGKGDMPRKGNAEPAGTGNDAMLAMIAEMQRTIATLQAQVSEGKAAPTGARKARWVTSTHMLPTKECPDGT